MKCLHYQVHKFTIGTHCIVSMKGHIVLLGTWSPRPWGNVSLCVIGLDFKPPDVLARFKLRLMLTEIKRYRLGCPFFMRTRSSFVYLSVVFVIRKPRGLPCFGKQQISIKTCIVWPWLDLVSTVTSSVFTLCPNTLELTRHFLRRLEIKLSGITVLLICDSQFFLQTAHHNHSPF